MKNETAQANARAVFLYAVLNSDLAGSSLELVGAIIDRPYTPYRKLLDKVEFESKDDTEQEIYRSLPHCSHVTCRGIPADKSEFDIFMVLLL